MFIRGAGLPEKLSNAELSPCIAFSAGWNTLYRGS